MPDPIDPNIATIEKYRSDRDCDVLVFSGAISIDTADAFVGVIPARPRRKKNVALFLTTYGGDPHAAYRIARALRRSYTQVRLLVCGYCKSAGTLVAFAADELAFGPFGELGPLDMQLRKPNEMYSFGSGLEGFQALQLVTDVAFDQFERRMKRLAGPGGGGAISTSLASTIAAQLTNGLFSPITGQIDPLRLAEANRAILIAHEYGRRLESKILKPDALERIVEQYPSHGFVIDLEEAQKLFENVRELDDAEATMAAMLHNHIRRQSSEPVICDVWEQVKPPTEEKNAADSAVVTRAANPRANGRGKPKAAGPAGGNGAKPEAVAASPASPRRARRVGPRA